MSTAYSSTPLAKKLGIKAGYKVKLINQPDNYFSLFTDMPGDIDIANGVRQINFIHFFTKELKELESMLPKLKKQIAPDGIIWISWPKKSAKITTNVSENLIREIALKTGLVDIKVCAIDETWSGLKLVIPVADRNK